MLWVKEFGQGRAGMNCLRFVMPGASATKPMWEPDSSGGFITHMSGTKAEMTQRPASTGTVNRSTRVWPFHVTWVSHSMATSSEIEHLRRDVQKASLVRKPGGSCMAFLA